MSLKNYWYIAAESRELGTRALSRVVYGEKVVLFRTSNGVTIALQDRCAHRNMALSLGRLIGDHILRQDVTALERQTQQFQFFGGARFSHVETGLLGLQIHSMRAALEVDKKPMGAELREHEISIRF